MSLIEREKEILSEIAAKRYLESSGRDYFKSNWKNHSYYEEPGTKTYLDSYQFNTPMEMRQILMDFFKERELPDELIPVVLAATFKLRDADLLKERVMETIYNF